jgi:ketosteroid isomerase-like protein
VGPEQIARGAAAALSALDADAYLELCNDDVELITPLSALDGAYVGESGVRHFFGEIAAATTSWEVEVHEIREVRPGRLLGFLTTTGASREGIQLSQEVTTVYDIANGKLSRVQVFADRDEAIEAASKQ